MRKLPSKNTSLTSRTLQGGNRGDLWREYFFYSNNVKEIFDTLCLGLFMFNIPSKNASLTSLTLKPIFIFIFRCFKYVSGHRTKFFWFAILFLTFSLRGWSIHGFQSFFNTFPKFIAFSWPYEQLLRSLLLLVHVWTSPGAKRLRKIFWIKKIWSGDQRRF